MEAARPSPPPKEKKGIQQVGVTPCTKHQLRADEQFPEEGGFGVTWARCGKSPESPQTLITHQKSASVPVRGGPIEQRSPTGGPRTRSERLATAAIEGGSQCCHCSWALPRPCPNRAPSQTCTAQRRGRRLQTMWGGQGSPSPGSPSPTSFLRFLPALTCSDGHGPATSFMLLQPVHRPALHLCPSNAVCHTPVRVGSGAAWCWDPRFFVKPVFPFLVFPPSGPVRCHWAPGCHAYDSRRYVPA